MVYSTVTGIRAYFGNANWNASTIPTLAQVENWCEEASSIVDAYIRNVVNTPVTDTIDLKVVTAIADMYVVDNINFNVAKNRTVINNTERVVTSNSHTAFYKKLQEIKDGVVILVNSVKQTTTTAQSGAQKNNLTFVSKKDDTQW